MLLAQKVGFGLRPEEDSNLGTVDALIESVTVKQPHVAMRSIKVDDSKIEQWPDEYDFTLEVRVKKARVMRKKIEALDADTEISEHDKAQQRLSLKKNYEHHFTDRVCLAHQAVYGADPVRQRFIHFWMNHFTVGQKDDSHHYIGHLYKDTISNGIDGNFEDLVYSVTRHPAMLTYLDNVYNVGEKSVAVKFNKGKHQLGLNDNLARELLELHTVSPRCGYTEDDIRNAAKILAGWGWIFDHPNSEKMFKNAGVSDLHDAYFKDMAEPGQKSVLGVKYKSGRSDLKSLTGNLAQSEFTREFISFKLCQHFISDRPNQDDVAYVTAQWKSSKGHLPTIHRAVIERASKSQTQKFNWPITWFLTVLRVSGANIIEGWNDLWGPDLHQGEQRAHTLFTEIGQDFWSRRQPNGFSSMGIDWASPEHMERRMRLASMIFKHGKPKLSASDIIQRSNASNQTRELLEKIASPEGKFVAALCSHEVMGKIENV